MKERTKTLVLTLISTHPHFSLYFTLLHFTSFSETPDPRRRQVPKSRSSKIPPKNAPECAHIPIKIPTLPTDTTSSSSPILDPDRGGGLALHAACRNYDTSITVITALLTSNFLLAQRVHNNGDPPLHLLLRCGEVGGRVRVGWCRSRTW